MEYGAGTALAHDFQVHQGFGACTSLTVDHSPLLIHFDQFVVLDGSFVDSARCHEQGDWVMVENHAEIATCSVAPAPLMQRLHGAYQVFMDGRHCFRLTQPLSVLIDLMSGSWDTNGCCARPASRVESGCCSDGMARLFGDTPMPVPRSCH